MKLKLKTKEKPFQLEEGKWYETRDGQVVGPIVDTGLGTWPMESPQMLTHEYSDDEFDGDWRRDGTWGLKGDNEHDFDLVREVPAPNTKPTPSATLDMLDRQVRGGVFGQMHIDEPGAWDGVLTRTLDDRAKDYGYFCDNARYAQEIKAVMESSPNWHKMQPHQREALDFTASKIGRLLSGDPFKVDTWHDIAGYMQLVETNLRGERR